MIKVEEKLIEKGVPYRLIKLNDNALTVADVLKFSNNDVNPEEICKTIVLRGKKSGKKIAILLRGVDKIDFSKAKKLFAEEIAIATKDEVMEASGVEPGAVCPFLLKAPLFVDEKVLALDTVNTGSGDHLYGLEFKLKDLLVNVEHQTVEISKKK